MSRSLLPLLLLMAGPAIANPPAPAGARARYVYETRLSDVVPPGGIDPLEKATPHETEDEGIGLSLDATYNTAAHRGGSWGFGAQYRRELGEEWALTVFGQVFPEADNSYSALDCGCGGAKPKESRYTEEETLWQAGVRLERILWQQEARGSASFFLEVAGPSLVSQRGLELQAGMLAFLELGGPLTLHGVFGGTFSSATLEQTRHAYAFGHLELDCTTGWLPNGSDHWFAGTYVESGEVKGEGAFVQFAGGLAFAPWNGVELEARLGTEVASPYDEKEDFFVQVGVTWSF